MRASRMYSEVFAIGRPIVIGCPLRTREQVDQIVVSVGPYMFHSSTPRPTSCSASATGSASPPHSPFSWAHPRHPESTSMRQVVGVACITVARA